MVLDLYKPYIAIRGRFDSKKALIMNLVIYFMVHFMEFQCPEEDSNLHALQHKILNLACLPFHHQGFSILLYCTIYNRYMDLLF